MRTIISINEVSTEEIDDILDRASAIEEGAYDPDLLNGKILANLFFEPSTRTQMSFVSAMFRLGGKVINLGSIEASSIAKGETLADTIRVVSGYADAIVLRHPKEGAARLASEFSDVPVINAGDGAGQHPSQTLLDLFTIRQSMPLDGINVGFLGDLRYGRTAHSLATALSRYGVTIHTITPQGLELPPSLVHDLMETGTHIVVHEHLDDIIADLDVLYVTRIQRERFPDPGAYASVAHGYRVTPEMLANVSERFILMHPLPRVDEIDPQVDSMPCAQYFRQARNGVPVRMAMLQKVLL